MITQERHITPSKHLPLVAYPGLNGLDFQLPAELEASEPPEARNLARDDVRLMVSYRADDRILHTHFRTLPTYLTPGDVLVINTSRTLNAAIDATRADGTNVVLHLSTRLPADRWIVEVRQPDAHATRPFPHAHVGETLHLPDGGSATLHTRYRAEPQATESTRLWIATLHLPTHLLAYLDRHGAPIRYHYVRQRWSLDTYQTVYANEPGSAEMPSAGRAFTPELLTHLIAQGIHIVPLILHTGVASLENHEAPYEEYYRVPRATAQTINQTRSAGQRIIAVGTTVVRALETVTDTHGTTHPGEGWTRLVITPQRGIRAVNALLTGLHEPRATHLAMLEALAGNTHLQHTYAEALRAKYLWHEFGDLHLILP